jgi:hypothetical protein
LPRLEELYKQYNSKGLVVVGLNRRESPEEGRAALDEMGVTFPNICDKSPAMLDLMKNKCALEGFPMTLIVDREGNLFESFYGFSSDDPTLMDNLAKLDIK